jgi:hypothetical protein
MFMEEGACLEMQYTRRERIKLLLKTLPDALGESNNDPRAAIRLESRTLRYGDLFRAGSYHPLLNALDEMRQRSPSVYWHTLAFYCDMSDGGKPRRRKADLGVEFLMRRMPSNVFVPQDVSENAGFSASEAKSAARPHEKLAA